MKVMRERVEAMKEIWTQDEASYHGEFVDFERIWSWPKPAQWPHPPVLVGGNGPTVLDRARPPTATRGSPTTASPRRHGQDRRAARALRRPPRSRSSRSASPPTPAKLAELEEAGVKRAVHWLPSTTRGPIERALDRFEDALADAGET